MAGYTLAIFVFILVWRPITGQNILNTKEKSQLIQAGKDQYADLNKRSNIPPYGSCWKNVISSLDSGCKGLTEQVQSDIALKFTNCFLKMSGHESYECDKSSGFLRKECMQDMSDRAFNVYTAFYTHTQNICFYLQSHFWHEETERTIDKLSSSSAKVTRQLEEAEQIQNTIFKYQKDSMGVQKELLQNGLTLREVLQESHMNLNEIMQEFRTSSVEQKMLLFDIFDRVASLREWAIGEISWFDTLLFYLSAMIVSYIITTTPRTRNARFFIYLSLTVNACLERLISTNVIKDGDEALEVVNEALSLWIWWCRDVLIALCAVILGLSIYYYYDYNMLNHNLLIQVREQNLKILKYLEKYKVQIALSKPINGKEPESKSSKLNCYHVDTGIDDTVSTSLGTKTPYSEVQSMQSPDSKNGTPEFHTHTTIVRQRADITFRSGSPSPSTTSTRSVGSYSSYRNANRRKALADLNVSRDTPRYNLRNHHASPDYSPV